MLNQTQAARIRRAVTRLTKATKLTTMNLKIHIHGRAEFSLPLLPIHVNALIECAQWHYDGRCRDTARTGGLLDIWKRMLETQRIAMTPPELRGVTCRFADLDLLTKVAENASVLDDPALRRTVDQLRELFGRALTEANTQSRTWQASVMGVVS